MKKTVVLAVLGMAAMATSALAQNGTLFISSYLAPPYAQIYWADGPNVGQALTAADGVTFQMYYGAGVQTSFSSLTPGATFTILNDPSSTAYDPGMGHGPGGYYAVNQDFPWAAGQTETFAFTVVDPTGQFRGTSILWQESGQIQPVGNPPNNAAEAPGLAVSTIPEPATFALAGLGAAALLIFRRRE